MRRKPRNEHFRVDPGDVTAENIRTGKFDLVFRGLTRTGGRKTATIVLDTWFVEYLARQLWKVVEHQKKDLANNERGLRGER